MKIKFRFYNITCDYENGVINHHSFINPIIVKEVLPNGGYIGMQGSVKVYITKTLKDDYYIYHGKRIRPLCYISDNLDSVFCLVNRNAISSLAVSVAHADGKADLSNYDKWIWRDNEMMNKIGNEDYMKILQQVKHDKYTNHYIVLDNPYKRFIRSLNKIYSDKLEVEKQLSYSNKSEFIDEALFYADLCENDNNFPWERHLGLQYRFYEECKKCYPNWQIVKFDEIQDWWENTFNSTWIKNNVSSDSQRPITLEDFTNEQRNKLDKLLEPDIRLWNEVK